MHENEPRVSWVAIRCVWQGAKLDVQENKKVGVMQALEGDEIKAMGS